MVILIFYYVATCLVRCQPNERFGIALSAP
jgi:hypothetical protein